MIGAILCPKVAARLLGLPVVFTFPRVGDFSGRVVSSSCMDHLGGAYLHKVRFDDEDEADYPFDAILKAHESYMRLNSADPPLGWRNRFNSVSVLRLQSPCQLPPLPNRVHQSFLNYRRASSTIQYVYLSTAR